MSLEKHVSNKQVPQTELIDEGLCFGWIDRRPRKLDEDRTMLRFSPRSSDNAWSKVNKEKTAQLTAENRMHTVGLASFQTAKENGTWDSLNDVDALIKLKDLAEPALPNHMLRDVSENFQDHRSEGFWNG